MTLQEAKDHIARKFGYDKWHKIDMYQLCEMYNVKHVEAFEETLHDEAAELYASSKLDADLSFNDYCDLIGVGPFNEPAFTIYRCLKAHGYSIIRRG